MTDKTLSEDEINTLYRKMADSFIDKANQLAGDSGPENVGMALLFAASRYNSFIVSQHSETLEAYEADLSKAKEFFITQYTEMLDENLESYKQVYNKYSHLMKQ